jgi:3-hydroxyacyl-CoA dehydrogenase/enoyl-CoA hydratase/3-hydroxybutyryl-CoA epimerase
MREDVKPADVKSLVERGQMVMNMIAALPIITVAAIHGAAVGGGYEMCLACDYRVAAPGRSTKIGLPETKIGLLPGWGGATRLPRLIGLPKALDIILGGKTVSAERALKFGMVDEVCPREHLVEAASRRIRTGKPKRPGHLMTDNPLVTALIARRARKEVMRKTRGNYPAVLKALEVAAHGLQGSIENSLKIERDGFVSLSQSAACRHLLRIFFLQERAKKLVVSGTVQSRDVKPVKHCAVIGAGVMGAGIAQWLSSRERSVVLRDINNEAVQKGMAVIDKLYRDGVKHGTFTRLEARDGVDRIHPVAAPVPLQSVDMVIEAAVENLEMKKKIFQDLEALVSSETILATNTSALPVSELAAAISRPDRVVGLHFFNPVHQMQLVEVVAARQTSPECLQRTLRLAQQIGKLPVLVKDSPGFLVNRILMPYLIEAANLFEGGASVTKIDDMMLDFGMPMGPLRLVDEVGLDVALHVAGTLATSFPGWMTIPDCLRNMVARGLLGRKCGAGFYKYGKSKDARPNPQAVEFVKHRDARQLSREELQERMFFPMANEAARCLQEGVVNEPADVDFAMIMGTGFAPFRGGPLRYVDSLGVDRVVGAMGRLADKGAAHFTPCTTLAAMAAAGKTFYPT